MKIYFPFCHVSQRMFKVSIIFPDIGLWYDKYSHRKWSLTTFSNLKATGIPPSLPCSHIWYHCVVPTTMSLYGGVCVCMDVCLYAMAVWDMCCECVSYHLHLHVFSLYACESTVYESCMDKCCALEFGL